MSLLTSIVILSGASAATAAEPVTAKAAFEKLKALAGEWKNKGESHQGESSKVVYRLTGNGTALMETDLPGTAHEMISMYHLDGDNLLLTHYCALGNQPRMKLDREKSTAETLVFAFDGGTNFNPAKDMHIHAVQFKFKTDGKTFESAWEAYKDGKPAHTETFRLTRVGD